MARGTNIILSESFTNLDESLPEEKDWELFYPQVVAFHQEYGHCNVPYRLNKYRSLHNWISKQRQKNKRNELSPLRKKLLRQIEFIWNPYKVWEIRLEELIAYKKKHNSFNVSSTDPVHEPLNIWIRKLRKRKNELPAAKRKTLNTIGFFPKEVKNIKPIGKEEKWRKMYAKLVIHFKLHGDCNVSVTDKKNPGLGFWVYQQRQNQDKLKKGQKKKLAQINFKWDSKQADQIEDNPRNKRINSEATYDQNVIREFEADQDHQILTSFKIFVTPLRIEVLRKILLRANDEFTKYDIMEDIISENIKISKDTVGSTLRLFSARRLIQKNKNVKSTRGIKETKYFYSGSTVSRSLLLLSY